MAGASYPRLAKSQMSTDLGRIIDDRHGFDLKLTTLLGPIGIGMRPTAR